MNNCCGWEEIQGFRSPGEYRDFIKWLESQIAEGKCEEVFNQGEIANEWSDRRFRCIGSDQVWTLSCPDPGYFPGSWAP